MTDLVSHQTVRLSTGRHDSPDDGVCVMELASMLAGEPFTDHPHAVDRRLGAFLRAYNDAVDDERRQDLYPLAAAVVGTGRQRGFRRRCRAAVRRELRAACGWWATCADDPAVRLAHHFARAGADGHERALDFVRTLVDDVIVPPWRSIEALQTAAWDRR